MNARFSLRGITVVTALCAIAFSAWAYQRGGIVVVVKNTDASTIRSVEVHVTGNSYDLGDIAPNTQKRVGVRPNSESHVEISFVDARNIKKRLVADCYFAPSGYKGAMEIEIRHGEIVQQTDSIRLRMY